MATCHSLSVETEPRLRRISLRPIDSGAMSARRRTSSLAPNRTHSALARLATRLESTGNERAPPRQGLPTLRSGCACADTKICPRAQAVHPTCFCGVTSLAFNVVSSTGLLLVDPDLPASSFFHGVCLDIWPTTAHAPSTPCSVSERHPPRCSIPNECFPDQMVGTYSFVFPPRACAMERHAPLRELAASKTKTSARMETLVGFRV